MDDKPRKGNERRVRIGGLLRCCIATIDGIEEETVPGDVHECQYCHQPTLRVADDGIWEWNMPPATAERLKQR